jgi:hypothetical protein
MDPQQESFNAVFDLIKQLIALSTGVVALGTVATVASSNQTVPQGIGYLGLAAWTLFLFAALIGIWAMMTATGMLADAHSRSQSDPPAQPLNALTEVRPIDPARVSIESLPLRKAVQAQIGCFALAMLFTLIFGWGIFLTQKKASEKTSPLPVTVKLDCPSCPALPCPAKSKTEGPPCGRPRATPKKERLPCPVPPESGINK